jgi:hypothetical protein
MPVLVGLYTRKGNLFYVVVVPSAELDLQGVLLVLVGATNCGSDSMIAGSITMEVCLEYTVLTCLVRSTSNDTHKITRERLQLRKNFVKKVFSTFRSHC